MAVRRLEGSFGAAAFDMGAQYITARDPAFCQRMALWIEAGVVAPWPQAGERAFVGVPAMNEPLRAMAAALQVRWSVRIEAMARVNGGWRLSGAGDDEGLFDHVVVALPAEQAALLVETFDAGFAALARACVSMPCWTLMMVFERPLAVQADCLWSDNVLGWAARNSAKPGRSGPEAWVVQATADWSRAHLGTDADLVAVLLQEALQDRLASPLPTVLARSAHRWLYARSGSSGEGWLWNSDLGLGMCGDWLYGPRVECAWLSGDALGRAMTLGPPHPQVKPGEGSRH
jgi:predicted NAD/FAD-dependent oxidoreductase